MVNATTSIYGTPRCIAINGHRRSGYFRLRQCVRQNHDCSKKHKMLSRYVGPIAFAIAVFAVSGLAAHAAPPDGFISLFNGKNLDGWAVRQTDNRDWSVVDGVIDCDPHGPVKGDRNLWTQQEYGDFELLVDWQIKEAPYVNRNARIMLRTTDRKFDS